MNLALSGSAVAARLQVREQPLGERRRVLRHREVVALRERATEIAQAVELTLGLDALRDGAQLQRLREPNDRSRQSGVLRAPVDSRHEGAVDLQDVDREALEIA